MTAVLDARGLGKQYRRQWALRGCDLKIPVGIVTGLVGPNGAGKTTLLALAAGMLAPSTGTVEVCGGVPAGGPEQLAKVGFVAQDTPTYAGLTVAEHLQLGAHLNPRWDEAIATSRVKRLGLDLTQKAGRLSGGQRAQLALTLGLAKRPELLILDEPVASLDPLARREFLQVLMEAVAEHELSVLLSSHVVSDLERVCEHLVVLVDSQVRVEGDVEMLLATHHRISGPRRDPDILPQDQHVVSASHTERQSTYVIRTERPILDPSWTVAGLSLEDLVLAYMEGAAQPETPRPNSGGPAMIWLTWRQLRTQLAAVYALVAAAVVTLAITGHHLRDLAKSKTSIYDLIGSTDRLLFNGGIVVMAVAPAVIGIFWGAPLVARELEAGTHRLVWNQSVTRTRWLAIKLGGSALAAAAAMTILSVAVSWWARPLDGAVGSAHGSLQPRMTPITFAMRGVVPVGYAVFAVVLGTVIGLVLRRSVPAMALTLAVYVMVQILVPLYVRPHLVAPVSQQIVLSDKTLDSLTSKNGGAFTITARTGSHNDWVLSNETIGAHGKTAALPSWFAGCLPPDPQGDTPTNVRVSPGPGTLDKCFARLDQAGYRQQVTYHPDGHFWRLQWAETAMYAGISALLAGFGFWWTRRRLS